MRLAVSNIAWLPDEDEAVHRLLVEQGVDAIEIAPTRLWPEPTQVSDADAASAASRLQDDGLETVSFQSLLFSRPDLQLFAAPREQRDLREHLKRIAHLAGVMGARRLVFGSPKNRRVPDGMTSQQAFDIAVDFFRAAGEDAAGEGTMLCIEPNPEVYGCNFVVTASDGVALVDAVGSAGFGLHLDAAGLVLADDDLSDAVRTGKKLVRHVHASAPQLDALELQLVDHAAFAAALRQVGYDGVVAIEMRARASGTNVRRVSEALRLALDNYARGTTQSVVDRGSVR